MSTQRTMTPASDDPNQTDLAAGYILDNLSFEEIEQLEQLLAESPEIANEIASLQEAFSLLPYDIPLLEPSAGLRNKVISAATQTTTFTGIEPSDSNIIPIITPRQRTWRQWIPTISTGIAAVAVIALGWNQVQLNWQIQQTAALQTKLDATDTELKQLRGELQANQETITLLKHADTQMYSLIGATSNRISSRFATARLFFNPSDRIVALVAKDLPKLSSNQIYRLWAVAAPTTTPLYCGQFRQNDGGTAQWVSPNAACTKHPHQLLITIDAPSDPITSAGPLVMRSPKI